MQSEKLFYYDMGFVLLHTHTHARAHAQRCCLSSICVFRIIQRKFWTHCIRYIDSYSANV